MTLRELSDKVGVGYAAVQVAARRLAGQVARQKRSQGIMAKVVKEIDVESCPTGLRLSPVHDPRPEPDTRPVPLLG